MHQSQHCVTPDISGTSEPGEMIDLINMRGFHKDAHYVIEMQIL